MFFLNNKELEIQILDPVENKNLLGSRYCTGGYIFQVKDVEKGNLLSGPHYPDHFDVFDGQGSPEVFVTALNQEEAKVGDDVFVLGVGTITRTSPKEPFHVRDNPVVKEFCTWEINKTADSITMTTSCIFNEWKFNLTKILKLHYRTLSSQTIVENSCLKMIPILWFAHPFFPVSANPLQCKFSIPITMEENEGYFIDDEGFIETRGSYNWQKGLYKKIAFGNQESLNAIQIHPVVGKITIFGKFVPHSIAIWANDKTFSFEPFYKAEIGPNEKNKWEIRYRF
jgi:hypothetical protein